MFSLGFSGKGLKTWEKSLKAMQKKSPEALKKAMEVGGLVFLKWANEGSPQNPSKPPIKTGFLRGSSSAFLDNKLIGVNDKFDSSEAARTNELTGKNQLTWVWNAEYAEKMHEGVYNLGPVSTQDGSSGPKWLERHLQADADALQKVIGLEFSKRTGMK